MQKALVSLLVLVTLVLALKASLRNSILSIYYYDVGQGDAALIVTPDNKKVLIDAGPNIDVLERVGETLPFWDKTIDYLIITHPDADHITGLDAISDRYIINQVIYSGDKGKSYLSNQVFEKLSSATSKLKVATESDDMIIGCCVNIDFIWPLMSDNHRDLSSNDKSIAFILHYGEFDAYFAGDLSAEYEVKGLINTGDNEVEVMKVSHHGSKTSTSAQVVALLDPVYAIISCAKSNKFGHPHDEVINRLTEANVKVMRTDEQGSIKLMTNGVTFWFG